VKKTFEKQKDDIPKFFGYRKGQSIFLPNMDDLMTNMPYTALIGLGGNVGDVCAHMCYAFKRLTEAEHSQLLVVSSLYRTPPWGKTDQPWFLNAAAALTTTLTPQKFLDFCLVIERECLRDRRERWGPRTLDIDLLFFIDNLQQCAVEIDDTHLTLPHPRIKSRAFVLLPLCDIAPDMVLEGKTVADWLSCQPQDEIEKVAQPQDWWQTTA